MVEPRFVRKDFHLQSIGTLTDRIYAFKTFLETSMKRLEALLDKQIQDLKDRTR